MNEKDVPKALKVYNGGEHKYYGRVHCPNCNKLLPVGKGRFENCPFCLQKLDWDWMKQRD